MEAVQVRRSYRCACGRAPQATGPCARCRKPIGDDGTFPMAVPTADGLVATFEVAIVRPVTH